MPAPPWFAGRDKRQSRPDPLCRFSSWRRGCRRGGLDAATAERLADHLRELRLAIGFAQHQHISIEPALVHDRVVGIPRSIKHLYAGPTLAHLVGELSAGHAV